MNYKEKQAKAWKSITETTPIPLGELCNWGQKNELNLNLQKADWKDKFCSGENINQFYNFGGLYVFWWIGKKKTLENGILEHLIQGKEFNKVHDVRRYQDAGIALPEIFTSKIKKSYLLQPITYEFDWIGEGPKQRTALYAGKASGVFDRVHAHLQWKKPFADFHEATTEPYSARVLSRHAGRQQLRAGFEYVFQEESEKKRKKHLYENVGITVHPSAPQGVSFRFFMEDYLIGKLRAAFNVDTER